MSQLITETYYLDAKGVLINKEEGVEAYKIVDNKYTSFVKSDIDETKFSNDYRIIGYDWKKNNNNQGANYTLVKDLYYIIKTDEGNYFKVRFTKVETDGNKFDLQIIKL